MNIIRTIFEKNHHDEIDDKKIDAVIEQNKKDFKQGKEETRKKYFLIF